MRTTTPIIGIILLLAIEVSAFGFAFYEMAEDWQGDFKASEPSMALEQCHEQKLRECQINSHGQVCYAFDSTNKHMLKCVTSKVI